MSLTIAARRELTPFERRMATGVEVAAWLTVGWLLTRAAVDGLTAIVVLAALVLIAFPDATACYANRFPPRTGPALLSRLPARAGSLRERRGGRRGSELLRSVGLVAIGLILGVTFVRGVYQGRGVQHDLAKRGVAVEAAVSGLFYGQHGLDKIEVTFAVQGQPVRHDLLLFGSVPSGLSHGSTLDVVYDPQRPSDVMLRSQIHGGTGSIVLASLMVLTILLACLRALWLAVRRPGAYGDVDPVRMSWSVS